jgi:hypothetical protein
MPKPGPESDLHTRTKTKYDELKSAIRDYGRAAFQNLLRTKALGEAVIAGFAPWLGCAPENVAAVPPEGPFDPREDYGDRAFSFHGRDVIILEPVRFGLSLVVGNVEDSGALWLRTEIAAEIAGDQFEVFVGAQPMIRAPLLFDGGLEEIYAAIHREFMDAFEIEVLAFGDQRFKTGIGFLPPKKT